MYSSKTNYSKNLLSSMLATLKLFHLTLKYFKILARNVFTT